MYPMDVFQLFPPFPRNRRVFVAMSFDARFTARWETVIQPGIMSIHNSAGISLEPHRVDARLVSDSILTEILRGIANDLLIVADITAIGKHDEYVIRNGNVMYEVGLAHSARLPEEVLLFRSDSYPLMFDIAGVRVISYDPEKNAEDATKKVTEALLNSLRELDQKRSLSVKRAMHSLGHDGFWVLCRASQGLKHPVVKTMGDVIVHTGTLSAVTRLLDLGLIDTRYPHFDPIRPEELKSASEDMFEYRLTPFGTAVARAITKELGFQKDNLSEWDTVFDEDISN